MTRGSLFAAVLGLASLLWTPAALAIDPMPPTGDGFGQVMVLKDKRAGFYEDVKKVSKQVTYVRDGTERPVTPGMTLYEGDAIRTADGTCVVVTPAGWRVEIGERSQVRLERGVIQRLGEVFYKVKGAFSVRVGDVQLLVEGTGFKVASDIPGNGDVAVPEGRIRVVAPAAEAVVDEGGGSSFTQQGPGEARTLDEAELASIAAWRAARFEPRVLGGTRRNRGQIRIEGGLSWFDGLATWGRGGVEGRVRAYGPMWALVGVGVVGRDVDETDTVARAFALPIHAGVRLVGDLPSSFFIQGGADFQIVVGERCTNQADCQRTTAVEPGGRLAIGAGLLLSRRVGFDLEFSGGLLRKTLPGIDASQPPTAIVDPQLHLSIGFFVRL